MKAMLPDDFSYVPDYLLLNKLLKLLKQNHVIFITCMACI